MRLSPAVILYDSDGNPVSVVNDSGVRRLGTLGKLLNASGTQVNPATEDTLALIKNTDGIKKITDQLPAGTNEIGKVAQGTRAVASGGWPEYIVDSSGNVVGVVLDGSIYRLQTEAQLQTHARGTTPVGQPTSVAVDANTTAIHCTLVKDSGHPLEGTDVRVVDGSQHPVGIVLDGALYRFQTDAKVAKGASTLVHLDAIDTVAGQGRLKATLYTQDGDPVSLLSASASIKNDFAKNGSATSLLVDGSVTPVIFSYDADATYDISLQEIRFTFVSNSITFGSNYFGSTSGPLTNGLLVEVICSGGTITLYNLLQNESFVNFASQGGFEWVVSSKDMMTAAYLIGGGLKLRHGTTDKVRLTVRDDIDSSGVYFKCFVKGSLLGVA